MGPVNADDEVDVLNNNWKVYKVGRQLVTMFSKKFFLSLSGTGGVGGGW
jgi:hypothetical protein